MNFSQYMGKDWPEGKAERWSDKQIDELMDVLRTNRNQLNGMPITAANAIASVQFDLIDAQSKLQSSIAQSEALAEALFKCLDQIAAGPEGQGVYWNANKALSQYQLSKETK